MFKGLKGITVLVAAAVVDDGDTLTGINRVLVSGANISQEVRRQTGIS